MSQLKMPKRGESARMLQELQTEHATESPSDDPTSTLPATHVTTLQETHEAPNADAHAGTNADATALTGAATHESSIELPRERSNTSRTPRDTVPRRARAHKRPDAPASSPSRTSERDERLAHALRRSADDEITVVTVRVATSLNRYMDDYTARVNRIDPKRKYRKQDAVLEAFAAFYADHPMPPAPEEEVL